MLWTKMWLKFHKSVVSTSRVPTVFYGTLLQRYSIFFIFFLIQNPAEAIHQKMRKALEAAGKRVKKNENKWVLRLFLKWKWVGHSMQMWDTTCAKRSAPCSLQSSEARCVVSEADLKLWPQKTPDYIWMDLIHL